MPAPVQYNLLARKPLVIYHAKCPDGFGAALAAWLRLKDGADYLPAAHDHVLPDVTGRQVYMLDIAFSLPVMQRVMSQAAELIVLDHHQSTADSLVTFECTCGKVHFDMTKSGARLAWEHFHPGTEVPALILHVEDRDLAKWLYEDTESYLASLDVGPYSFHRWAGVMHMPEPKLEEFLTRGRAMYEQAQVLAKALAAEAQPLVLNGVRGLVANAPYTYHTAVGLLLAEQCGTFAAVWCLEKGAQGQRVRVGLRSLEGQTNVIPIAEAFGGGGHPGASAFRMPVGRLQELLAGELMPHEAALPA